MPINKNIQLPRNGGNGIKPKAEELQYGSLAVNYCAGNEFLATKNSNNDVVVFPSENYLSSHTLTTKGLTVDGSLNVSGNTKLAGETLVKSGDTFVTIADYVSGISQGDGNDYITGGTASNNTLTLVGKGQAKATVANVVTTDKVDERVISAANGNFVHVSGDTMSGNLKISSNSKTAEYKSDSITANNGTISFPNSKSGIIALDSDVQKVGVKSLAISADGNKLTLTKGDDTTITADTTAWSSDNNDYLTGITFLQKEDEILFSKTETTDFDLNGLPLGKVNIIVGQTYHILISSNYAEDTAFQGTHEFDAEAVEPTSYDDNGYGTTVTFNIGNNPLYIKKNRESEYKVVMEHVGPTAYDFKLSHKLTNDSYRFDVKNQDSLYVEFPTLWEKKTSEGGVSLKNADNTASGEMGLAEGSGNTANGVCSHVEGGSSSANGSYSHAEGFRTIAIGTSSHAEGSGTTASGDCSHAEGCSFAKSNYSHAEGGSTSATSIASHAEGSGTTASGKYSHAEGRGTKSVGEKAHAEGSFTNANGVNSHAEGEGTSATSIASHAEGSGSLAKGKSSHAEGGRTIASGDKSHAEGSGTTASGDYSHAEGQATSASGMYSHAEGWLSEAKDFGSHAEGYGSLSKGLGGHVEGLHRQSLFITEDVSVGQKYIKVYRNESTNCFDLDYFKHCIIDCPSQNFTCNVTGATYTTKEGLQDKTVIQLGLDKATPIEAKYANAEAINQHGTYFQSWDYVIRNFGTTDNYGQHAEGKYTVCIGDGSHAEGENSMAVGSHSHAEGEGSVSYGDYSHTEGDHTIAKNRGEHACGRYNRSGETQVFSIGVGDSDSNRKNAFFINENGAIGGDLVIDSAQSISGLSIDGGLIVSEGINAGKFLKAEKIELPNGQVVRGFGSGLQVTSSGIVTATGTTTGTATGDGNDFITGGTASKGSLKLTGTGAAGCTVTGILTSDSTGFLPTSGGTLSGTVTTTKGIVLDNSQTSDASKYKVHITGGTESLAFGLGHTSTIVSDGALSVQKAVLVKNGSNRADLISDGVLFDTSNGASIISNNILDLYTGDQDSEIKLSDSGITIRTDYNMLFSSDSENDIIFKATATDKNDFVISKSGVTAEAYYVSSDKRLKRNVENVPNDDIEKIKKVPLKSFVFKSDNTKHFGVIAQEVENAGLDELVKNDAEGIKSVDYTSLLILKIAELEKEIKVLKEQINKK